MSALDTIAPLAEMVAAFDLLVTQTTDEACILSAGGRLLERLVAKDDWLPSAFACPDSVHYAQFLLYQDPGNRFSVASLVWAPGQKTPIHDHTSWGLVGVLRGA